MHPPHKVGQRELDARFAAVVAVASDVDDPISELGYDIPQHSSVVAGNEKLGVWVKFDASVHFLGKSGPSGDISVLFRGFY